MRERELAFEVGGSPDIEVRVSAGSIRLVEGLPNRISVSISGSNPDKLLVEQFRDHVQIGQEGKTRGSYRIGIEVPPDTSVVTATGSANVESDAPLSDFSARTASGNIDVSHVAGDVTIKTASGSIRVGEVGGVTRAVTAAGRVSVLDSADDCSIVSASGNIEVSRARGGLKIKTASGDTLIERFEGDTLACKSVSGDVACHIPTGTSVDLDLQTLSGRVDLPPAPSSAPRSAGPRVRVGMKSVSGDIRIGRAAPLPAEPPPPPEV